MILRPTDIAADPSKFMWNFLDSRDMLPMPWYTEGMLRELFHTDVSGWRVFEWGGGYSTGWWARRAAEVFTVEASSEWAAATSEYVGFLGDSRKSTVHYVPVDSPPDEVGTAGDCGHPYPSRIDGFPPSHFDCIVIDGMYRLACADKALGHLKPNGTVILDNSEFDATGAIHGLFRSMECRSYPQSGHPSWTTTRWTNRPGMLSDVAELASSMRAKIIRAYPTEEFNVIR